jgi:hypothetical protein
MSNTKTDRNRDGANRTSTAGKSIEAAIGRLNGAHRASGDPAPPAEELPTAANVGLTEMGGLRVAVIHLAPGADLPERYRGRPAKRIKLAWGEMALVFLGLPEWLMDWIDESNAEIEELATSARKAGVPVPDDPTRDYEDVMSMRWWQLTGDFLNGVVPRLFR